MDFRKIILITLVAAQSFPNTLSQECRDFITPEYTKLQSACGDNYVNGLSTGAVAIPISELSKLCELECKVATEFAVAALQSAQCKNQIFGNLQVKGQDLGVSFAGSQAFGCAKVENEFCLQTQQSIYGFNGMPLVSEILTEIGKQEDKMCSACVRNQLLATSQSNVIQSSNVFVGLKNIIDAKCGNQAGIKDQDSNYINTGYSLTSNVALLSLVFLI